MNGAAAQSAAERSSSSAEPASYRLAIERAIEEFGLGNFEEAREQFAQAYRAFPNARALRGLGMSEFELRNYVEAADFLKRALASEVRALDGKARRDTESLLARATSYVGEVALKLTPAGASVLVDGARKTLDAGATLQLNVGRHALEFQAEGYSPVTREVTVHGAQVETLEVALRKVPAKAASAASGEEGRKPGAPYAEVGDAPRSDRKPVYKRWWLWTLVGVVVVSAAAGTVVALSLRDQPAEYTTVPTGNTPPGVGLAPLVRY